MYDLEIKPDLDKIFKKLAKKNIKQLEIINKKIAEIRNNPHSQIQIPEKTTSRLLQDTLYTRIECSD